MSHELTPSEIGALLDGVADPALKRRILDDPNARRELTSVLLALATAAKLKNEPTAQDLDLATRVRAKLAPQIAAAAIAGERKSHPASQPAGSAMRLAADSGAAAGTERSYIAHAAFVDQDTQVGHIRPVIVEIERAGSGVEVAAQIDCDRVMAAAAERAIHAAMQVLRDLGVGEAGTSGLRVNWTIAGAPASYSGASIGLAIALAVVAAVSGVRLPDGVVASGSVSEDGTIGHVAHAARKLAAASRERLATVLLPAAVAGDLPAAARSMPEPRLLLPRKLDEAVLSLLGVPLGIVTKRLAAATESDAGDASDGETAVLELWLSQPTSGGLGGNAVERGMMPVPDRRPNQWLVGDRVAIHARCSRAAHLAIFNFGTSGRMTMLLPNADQPRPMLRAGEVLSYPDGSAGGGITLTGPAGIERLVAVACDEPIEPPPPGQWALVVEPQDIAATLEKHVRSVRARAELAFNVVQPPPTLPRGAARSPTRPESRRMVSSDF